jgi:hypothetical protein
VSPHDRRRPWIGSVRAQHIGGAVVERAEGVVDAGRLADEHERDEKEVRRA